MKLGIIIVLIFFTGCVVIPELEPGAESIKVISTGSLTTGCSSLGLVYGYSDNGFKGYGGRGGVSQRHSMYDAKNKAYKLNADTILIINTNSRVGGTDTIAEAFKCKSL